jgi:hypothetical protein
MPSANHDLDDVTVKDNAAPVPRWLVLGASVLVSLAVGAAGGFVFGHSQGRLDDNRELTEAQTQSKSLTDKLTQAELKLSRLQSESEKLQEQLAAAKRREEAINIRAQTAEDKLRAGAAAEAKALAQRREEEKRKAVAPSDMSLKEFILQKPAKPTAVQVVCQLGAYYNYAFSGCAETHYSFRVRSDSPSASANGYAPKDSEHGRRLYELLKDGSARRMTIRLQRVGPHGNALPAKDDDCFALVGVVDSKK